jgi:hypothetical protein
MLTLASLRVTSNPPALAKTRKVLPTGQNLVYVGLMPGVKDNGVIRRLENPVQCDRKLNDTEVGAQMSAASRHIFN